MRDSTEINSAASGWHARLHLAFASARGRTTLVGRAHEGPLLVQKPLYPEGDAVCQCVIVHPPGGIAGGDHLALEVGVGAGAHAQLTTPGATKWYRSAGRPSEQRIIGTVAAGGMLEWLPQDTIVFDGAHARSSTRISLAADAQFLGWDITRLGRTESAERFTRGEYRQCTELFRDGKLIWAERARLIAGESFATAATGLNGMPVFGTFVVAAPGIDDALLATWRKLAPDPESPLDAAVTRLPGVLIARCRGASTEAARAWFAALWSVARMALCGRAAVAPRIWNT